MHSLLRRQLKRYFGSHPVPDELLGLLELIDKAYHEFDSDRLMLERSLDLSSRELLQANSDMRAIFRAFPDLFFRLDNEGLILDCKGGGTREFSLPPERLIGKRIQDVPEALAARLFADAIEEVSRTGSPVSVEYSLSIEGQNAFYEARLLPVLEDQLLAVVRNITKRKLAEEELESRTRSNLTKQAALQELALSVGPNLTEALHKITRCAAILLGVERVGVWLYNEDRSAIGCEHLCLGGEMSPHSGILVESKDYPRYFAALDKSRMMAAHDACEDPRTSEFAESYLRPLGITSMLDVAVRVHGKVVGLVGIEHVGPQREWALEEQDFSASIADLVSVALEAAKRQQLENQLRQSQKMEAIGLLAGGIAHDFNNLLNVIVGFTDLGLMKLQQGHAAHRYLSNVAEAARRATELTRKLLTLSRRQVLEVEPIDLNELVRDFVLLGPIVREDVEVDIQTADTPLVVKGDRSQLDQVLMNLCMNARQAMQAGGKLTIRVARTVLHEGVAQHRSGRTGDYVHLTVSDDGIGMSEETQARIWEPFFTTKDSGSGLGLSMVYGSVEKHGGFVEVDSEAGFGSTFHIFIPMLHGAAPAMQVDTPVDLPTGTETILVAEDEPMLRDLVATSLSDLGYRVVVAQNGEQAVREFKNHASEISLVVLDVVMPKLSGPEAFLEMRAMRPDLKAIFASGYAPEETRLAEVLDQKNVTFMPKPVVMEELASRLREMLDAGPSRYAQPG